MRAMFRPLSIFVFCVGFLFADDRVDDVGFTVKRPELVSAKTGFFLGLGGGLNMFTLDNADSFNNINFDFGIGFSAFINEHIGFRVYLNMDDSLGFGSAYASGALNLDLMLDLRHDGQTGMGFGMFVGLGYGAGVGMRGAFDPQMRLESDLRSGLFSSLNVGLSYLVSRSDRLDFSVRKHIRPAATFRPYCPVNYRCQLGNRNVNSTVVGVNYNHVF